MPFLTASRGRGYSSFVNISPSKTVHNSARTKKWLIGAIALTFGLAACGDSSEAPTTETNDATNDAQAQDDVCEVSAEHEAQFEAAEEPSDVELDELRNEVFSDMDCLDDEVETVELADLSTLVYMPDGGFTWYPETEELANRGFAVSVGGGQLVEDVRDLSPNEVEEILIDYVDKYQDSEDWEPGKSAIGGWQNPDTGDVALNISIVEDDITVAREIGVEHDQLAIFDLQLETSVWTDGVTP